MFVEDSQELAIQASAILDRFEEVHSYHDELCVSRQQHDGQNGGIQMSCHDSSKVLGGLWFA